MLLMNLPSKEKQKITEIKNYLQIISSPLHPVRLIHYCYRVTSSVTLYHENGIIIWKVITMAINDMP